MSFEAVLHSQNGWWKDPSARPASAYPVRRDLQRRVLDGFARASRAIVVSGPRQVGKTVLLWQIAEDLLNNNWPPANLTYFDFSDDRLTEPVSPRQVVEALPVGLSHNHPRIFLLDEVGVSSNWMAWLKHAVDESRAKQKKHRFVVTDSAASVLLAGLKDSAQGRWEEERLEGLNFGEYLRFLASPDERTPEETLRRVPNALERYLTAGGFPEHIFEENADLVRDRLRKDIADRAILSDLLRFGVDVARIKRLFVYLAQESGGIFDAGKWTGSLDADKRSIEKWVELLANTRLIDRLDRHSKPPAAKLKAKPRLFASDHGFVVAFSALRQPLLDGGVRGRVFEAAVFRHLRGVMKDPGRLGFYRADESLEVDFVLGNSGPAIIEVTSSDGLDRAKLESLKEIGERLKARDVFLVYGGATKKLVDAVQVVPLLEFLLDPARTLGEGAST